MKTIPQNFRIEDAPDLPSRIRDKWLPVRQAFAAMSPTKSIVVPVPEGADSDNLARALRQVFTKRFKGRYAMRVQGKEIRLWKLEKPQ